MLIINHSDKAPLLKDPGFPDAVTAIPLTVEYMRGLQDEDFWNARRRTVEDLRPPAADKVSARPSDGNSWSWRIVKSSMAVALTTPTASAFTVDRLIGLDVAGRTRHSRDFIDKARKRMRRQDKAEKKLIFQVRTAGNSCEIYRGTPDYRSHLEDLVRQLDALLKSQETRIRYMVQLEKLGESMDGEFLPT